MKAKTAIYFHVPGQPPEIVRSPDPLMVVLRQMERLEPEGTLRVNRLTGAGKVKRSYIPRPTILRVEEA